MIALAYTPEAADCLRARRKAHVARREEWLALQRDCGKRGDRDGARLFKGEAAGALRSERAATLVLEYLEGDRSTMNAPDEIATYVRQEAACADYGIAA